MTTAFSFSRENHFTVSLCLFSEESPGRAEQDICFSEFDKKEKYFLFNIK